MGSAKQGRAWRGMRDMWVRNAYEVSLGKPKGNKTAWKTYMQMGG